MLKIHWCHGETLWASKRSDLWVSSDCGQTWKEVTHLPSSQFSTLAGKSRLLQRALRSGVRSYLHLHADQFMAFANGMIYLGQDGGKTIPIGHVRYGSGPLACGSCITSAGMCYYGDYWGNSERREVNIYSWRQGQETWQPVYTFSPGRIRHVHGILCDPYDHKIWVTTGDSNQESGIWVTDDQFQTLAQVAGGGQQIRAVQLLFTQRHVYFGSDTPLETNHIYRLDKHTGKIEMLQAVASSVFWGCKVGDALFFSTAVEPSQVNTCRDACIWGSKDGEHWQCLARFRKDRWPLKLFQYGQILFPAGENKTEYLWFTPFATEQDLTIQRIKIADLWED